MKKTITLLLVFFSMAIMPLKAEGRNPATAFIYSAAVPGLGQMYNNQVGKGLIFFFATGILGGVTMATSDTVNYGISEVSGVVAGLFYLYQLVEAPLVTKSKFHLSYGINKIQLATRF
jgi:TM2 domain-containing membrane protein YozV